MYTLNEANIMNKLFILILTFILITSTAAFANPEPSCFGEAASSPMVCSGFGTCIAQDTCQCAPGFAEPDCRPTGPDACFFDPMSFECMDFCMTTPDPICMDVCQIDPNAGPWCGPPQVCFNIPSFIPDVCSGNGMCVALDTCACQPDFIGPMCETALPYFCSFDVSPSGWFAVSVPNTAEYETFCSALSGTNVTVEGTPHAVQSSKFQLQAVSGATILSLDDIVQAPFFGGAGVILALAGAGLAIKKRRK